MKCLQMGQTIFLGTISKIAKYSKFRSKHLIKLYFDVETLKVGKMVFFNNLYFFEVNMLRNLTNGTFFHVVMYLNI